MHNSENNYLLDESYIFTQDAVHPWLRPSEPSLISINVADLELSQKAKFVFIFFSADLWMAVYTF